MPEYNPMEIAYKALVAYRDENAELDIDEVIGYLGEALSNNRQIYEFLEACRVDLVNTTTFAVDILSRLSGGNEKITKELVEEAYRKGIIELIVDPNLEAGTVAIVGEVWFSFGGQTAEEYGPESYKALIPEETIISKIYEVINYFRMGENTIDEYNYILCHIYEQLPEAVTRIVKSESVVQSMDTDVLINELIRRQTDVSDSIHQLIDQSGYIAYKLWTEDDVTSTLEEEGFAPTRDNVEIVLDTGMLKCLNNCSDQDWGIIREAIMACQDSLEEAEK